MTRKRTRRKYHPPRMVDPVAYAIAGVRPLRQDLADKLRMLELQAIAAFAEDRAEPDDWRSLTDMMNVCAWIARTRLGPEAIPHCERAEKALAAARERRNVGGRLYLKSDEIGAIREVYAYMDEQRRVLPVSEYEKALHELKAAILKKHAAGELVTLED